MSKQREALQMALDALRGWIGIDEWIWPVSAKETCKKNSIESITAIREALAEQEQEPVAVVTSQTGDPITMSWHHEPALPIGTKLYAAPPARKPLTDAIATVRESYRGTKWGKAAECICDAIENKLRGAEWVK